MRAGAAGVLRTVACVNMLRPPATAGWQWCARVRSFCGFVNRQSARTGPGRSRLPRRRCCYSSVSRRHRTRPAHGAVQTRGACWWWASSRGWGGRTRSLPQLWARCPPLMLPERAPPPPARGHWNRGGDRAVRGLCSCRQRPMHARGGGRLYVCVCKCVQVCARARSKARVDASDGHREMSARLERRCWCGPMQVLGISQQIAAARLYPGQRCPPCLRT